MSIFSLPDGERVRISTGDIRIDGVSSGSALYWATATSDIALSEGNTWRRRFTDIEPKFMDSNDIWLNEEVESNDAAWARHLESCLNRNEASVGRTV